MTCYPPPPAPRSSASSRTGRRPAVPTRFLTGSRTWSWSLEAPSHACNDAGDCVDGETQRRRRRRSGFILRIMSCGYRTAIPEPAGNEDLERLRSATAKGSGTRSTQRAAETLSVTILPLSGNYPASTLLRPDLLAVEGRSQRSQSCYGEVKSESWPTSRATEDPGKSLRDPVFSERMRFVPTTGLLLPTTNPSVCLLLKSSRQRALCGLTLGAETA